MKVTVDKLKITQYLLNTDHPDGSSKAHFFARCGFEVGQWQVFESALIKHYNYNKSTSVVKDTVFGKKFIITGLLETPVGENVLIKSVWFNVQKTELIKLVSAYPFQS